MTVLKGGSVLTQSGFVRADVAVEGTRIVSIDQDLRGAQTVDCSGCLIGPGFVDIHVHFREPGQVWKENIETGSHAAAAGGFTAVVPMANTEPATDSPLLVSQMLDRGRAVGLVDLVPAAALTMGRAGSIVGPIEDLWEAGARIFSDDGDSVEASEVLEEAMVRVGRVGGLVGQHAEDRSIAADGHMHEGEVSRELGIRGLPAEAEERVVARDLDLAEKTGVRYHVQHASTAGTVALVQRAKTQGLRVSAEAAPHHFQLDHRRLLNRDTIMKMYPPLRTASDVAAVSAALVDGTIDAVATDHAPHTADEKDASFEAAPRGIIGLETAASLAWSILGADPSRFFDRMSVTPARLGGFTQQGQPLAAGSPANLVVFDPEHVWRVESFASRSQNSPWLGETMKARAVVTVYNGRITHRTEGR